MLTLEQKSPVASPLPPLAGLSPRIRLIGLTFVYVLLIGLTLSPLLWVEIPPLVDYPNHLARMAVLLHDGDGQAITSNYVVEWKLLPNLAMDLVVPTLARLLPLEIAGRLFVGTTMALLVLGTASLYRTLHGRFGLWPLCSVLFVYNAVLYFGFLNYLFGLGIALLGFSAWIASENWSKAIRLSVFSILAALILVLHGFALGVFGLLVLSYEMGRLQAADSWSRAAILSRASALIAFIPAGVLWLSAASGPKYTAYGGINARIFALIAPAAFNIPPTALDAAVLIITLAVLPATLLSRLLRLSPAMRLPLIAMLVVAVCMPEYASGSWAAHIRLPVALVFVFIASTRPDSSRRVALALLASALLTLWGLRIWAVTADWRDMEARMTELRTALQTVPEGVRLLTVQSGLPANAERLSGPRHFVDRNAPTVYTHFASLAVIDRGVFITPLFTNWTPVTPSYRNRDMSRILGGLLTPEELQQRRDSRDYPYDLSAVDLLGEPLCCLDWPRHFNFVLWTDFGQPPHDLPKELRPWASGSFFHLYRIMPP